MVWLRALVVLIFLGHGIGHILGLMAAWTTTPAGFTNAPWVLPGAFSITSPVGKAWALLWLVALIGFVGAGLGLWFGQAWWPALAAAAAAVSLVAIVPWWNTVVPGAQAGALLDVVVLVAAIFWGEPLRAWLAG